MTISSEDATAASVSPKSSTDIQTMGITSCASTDENSNPQTSMSSQIQSLPSGSIKSLHTPETSHRIAGDSGENSNICSTFSPSSDDEITFQVNAKSILKQSSYKEVSPRNSPVNSSSLHLDSSSSTAELNVSEVNSPISVPLEQHNSYDAVKEANLKTSNQGASKLRDYFASKLQAYDANLGEMKMLEEATSAKTDSVGLEEAESITKCSPQCQELMIEADAMGSKEEESTEDPSSGVSCDDETKQQQVISFENAINDNNQKKNITSLSTDNISIIPALPSPLNDAEDTLENTSLADLGLSCNYSLSEHAPKYSESQMSAKIAAAVAQAVVTDEERLVRIQHERDTYSQRIVEMEDKYAAELAQLKQDMSSQQREERVQHEQALSRQAVDLTSQVKSKVTSALSEKLRLSEEENQFLIENHHAEIQLVRNEHTSEIDEMLKQLDAVEEEQMIKVKQLEQALVQKETVISALSSQLVEANTSNQGVLEERNRLLNSHKDIEEELSVSIQTIAQLERDVENLQSRHAQAMKGEEVKRRKAVESANAELRAAAEAQFGEANRCYLKLKSDYDLDREKLKKVNEKMIGMEKEEKQREVKVMAEVARLKAALASAEANLASSTQAYTQEMSDLKQAQIYQQQQKEEAVTNCKTAHMSLATLVAAKEQIAKENEDLKSVCEELMAIVEGGQQ